MITNRRLTSSICALALSISLLSSAHAEILETWESQPATNPFAGTGDLTWSGDVAAWAITTATWPTSPAQDFAGQRSLRSANHGSTAAGQVVETIVTNISSEFGLTNPLEWSVFLSGNSISIQPNRRADIILLSDTSNVGAIEDPDNAMNGYKLTLNDPYADGTDNIPPSSHESAAVADSLTLWRVTDADDRWRVVGSIPLGATDDIRDGWNIRARLNSNGTWEIGFANGAIGQVPVLTSLGFDVGGPTPSTFVGTAYAGVGWTAPFNTTNDHSDFGFDNFSVRVVPEPTAALLAALCIVSVAIGRRRR